MNLFSLLKRKILYKIKKKTNIDFDGISKSTLDELFHYYGSDKANYFKITKSRGHGFSDFYTQHLKHLKEKEIKFLEIGSYAGASAAAFIKYFKNCSVYCFDINISKFVFMSKNIHVYGLNINNEKKLKKILKKINLGSNSNFFDVIIDDGSHYLSDILLSLKILFRYLRKGGIYIIEDFKYPNYYEQNRNIKHIMIDQVLKNLKEKKLFSSSIISSDDQIYLQNNIGKIITYKGNLKNSDICFIEKI
ncbi:MAG: class I SAM-dependent methyltransferase [Candidatus Pelagibacter sp. TMED153]|nr:MAG: class I SAM-dependent methyltransferase [Candidatus Pelagibacter sp. TMED153]